jgi:hypothetical protein
MGLVWNPWAIPGLIAVALAAALCVFVYLVGPERIVNRRLAVLLAFDTLDVLTSFSVTGPMTDHVAEAYAWGILHFITDLFVIASYLLFLGVALDTPLARPFRARAAPWILYGAATAGGILFALRPDTLLGAGISTGYRPFPWAYEWGPWVWVLWSAVAAAFTYGLVTALHAWIRARGTPQRRRLGAYLLAFGTRDAGWAIIFGTLVYWGLGGAFAFPAAAFLAILYAAVLALYVLFLAYAILYVHVFDIDLKLKWTLSRGTVATVFLAAFLVASQLVQNVTNAALGLVGGAVAAGMLLLALTPLQRMAERLADAAMPRVRDTREYRLVRKREVYEAAVQSVYQDGDVTERERDTLALLAEKLGLGPAEARGIERRIAKGAAR